MQKTLALVWLFLLACCSEAPGAEERPGGGTMEAPAACTGQCSSFVEMMFTLEHRGPGTEVNYIVAYDDALFATVSVWNAKEMRTPVTVLRKDAPEAPWVVDFALPQTPAQYHGRSEHMSQLRFTMDYTGAALTSPASLLVLGAGQQTAPTSGQPWANTLWTRTGPGEWKRTLVSNDVVRPCDDDDKPSVRSMAVHYDAVARREYLFVGTGNGQIYRAGYDPAAPGRLRLDSRPLFQGSGRVISLRSTPFGLFASVSQKDLGGECSAKRGLPEGLFRYVEGSSPVDIATQPLGAFVLVDQWESAGRDAEDSCRGLTLIEHPRIAGEYALFGGLEDPGHLVYWDALDTTPTRHLEFDILQGMAGLGEGVYPGVRIGPYNEFTEARDPREGSKVHLVGLFFRTKPDDVDSHVLIRQLDGSYGHLRVPSPDGRPLRGTRTIVPSPWAEEAGKVFYLGGFDAAGAKWEDSAWILKGRIPTP